MLAKVTALWRLARPWLLLDALGLFTLGVLVARYEGHTVDLIRCAWGLVYVGALQLMAICLNEYWDEAGDRGVTRRTPFSGGSGVLAERALSRAAVFAAAMFSLAVGVGAAAILLFRQPTGPAVWAVMALIFLGLFFQSSPPVALMSTGYGEITTAIVFAGLAPALAHLLLAGEASLLLLLTTAPLVTLHIAVLIAFGLPDYEADRASGKRTLVVRLGQVNAAALHNGLLAGALALTALSTFAGLPARVAISAAFIAPLVVLQMIVLHRLQRGLPASFFQLTMLAALLFGLSAYLTAFSFWVIG